MWHQLKVEQLEQELQVNLQQGLGEEDVTDRIKTYGFNELKEAKRVSPILLFLNQFKDFMVVILMAATLVSGLLGEYVDSITILAILLLNAVLGFIQEFKAERSLHALKQLSAPLAKVYRSCEKYNIPAKMLVPGDVIIVESGDRVPADIRWTETNNLEIEESVLTGESVSSVKHEATISGEQVALGDLKNIGFMGTMVTRGTARGVVIRTGMTTEMGKIADLIQNTEQQETPLQHRLEQLGKVLIMVALALTFMVVLAGIMHGQPLMGMFLAGVTLAVAAIPEGLPAIVTIALALGVQRMIKRKAIVRKLPSVETLGCASVICSDKTGTLTQNKMTVTNVWVDGYTFHVTGNGYRPDGDILKNNTCININEQTTLRQLLHVCALCNNAQIICSSTEEECSEAHTQQQDDEAITWSLKGDPTEGALLTLCSKTGIEQKKLSNQWERIKEFPFDSDRKTMSVIVSDQENKRIYTKGAPELLIDKCNYILWNGKEVPFTAQLRKKAMEENERMGMESLRVIGMAYRRVASNERVEHENIAERNLVFIGLTGMMDPPRKEVRSSISTCKKAGIKTVMITGDHTTTAIAIATSLGILPPGGKHLLGQQMANMSDEQLEKVVDDTYVYARVSPEHKLKIVQCLQKKGHVVAMTGDGVNDAPAIKAADIGICMGISGTDVTKEASALVLSDDNFSTIVTAVEEGRNIYENIRKFIRYLLASNVGEILTMFLAMMAGLPLPLLPIQILWVNLVTDGLPAMALGVDQPEEDLMEHRPRTSRESIFARRLGWKVASRGIMIGVCTLASFWMTLQANVGQEDQLARAQSVAFMTLVLSQLIHVFDCRSSRSIFHRNIFQNKYLVAAVISSIVLTVGVMYIEPLRPIFKTVPLGFREWALTMVYAGFPTFFLGIGSVLGGRRSQRKLRAAYYFPRNTMR